MRTPQQTRKLFVILVNFNQATTLVRTLPSVPRVFRREMLHYCVQNISFKKEGSYETQKREKYT